MFGRKKQTPTNKIRHLITKLNPRSPITEQYRTIRTNLQFSSVDEDLQSIVITSADPGAGKSITAANLAVVYAQQGLKTLLVDADLRKPTVHYTFRLNNLNGLSNVLIGASTLEDATEQTDVDDLHVMSSGPIPPNPAELLASNRMEEILHQTKQLYDIIIFDTPPTLAVADAKIMTNIVDGTIIVVRSKQTEIEEVERSIQMLQGSKARLLGTILNAREKSDSNYYYYYGT